MKKIAVLCVMLAGVLACGAQTVIDHFNVGPYVVDYLGEGEVNYRLMDNVDLYEFYELKRDTTKIIDTELFLERIVIGNSVESAFQVSVSYAAGMGTAKQYGVEGLWKRHFTELWAFNVGLGLNMTNRKVETIQKNYTTFEAGVPLQIEYGKLVDIQSTLYGVVGLTPTYYSATRAAYDNKKSGFFVAPYAEFGGNVKVARGQHIRIGAFATYKIANDYYKDNIGRAFIGGKIGLIF